MIRAQLAARPPGRRYLPMLAGTALVVTVGLTGAVAVAETPGLARLGQALDRLPAAGVEPAPPRRSTPSATVTLVTGERIRLDAMGTGRPTVTVESGGPGRTKAQVARLTLAGDEYVFPTEVLPYLGRTLDPRLFNVSYLARAGLDDARTATVPVTVRADRQPAVPLPGVRVGRASGGVATGAVVKSQAGGLGRLLASQWKASVAGTSPAPLGELPGVDGITLAPPAGAPAPPPAPDLTGQGAVTTASGTQRPFRTVTLNPIDRDGRPAVSLAYLHAVDGSGTFVSLLSMTGEPLAVSVPEGLYSVEASVMTGFPLDPATRMALVVKPEVRVDSDETLVLDGRTATQFQMRLTEPVTESSRQDIVSFSRYDEAGNGIRDLSAFELSTWRLYSAPDNGQPDLYVTPTGPVRTGTFAFTAFSQIVPGDPQTSTGSRHYLVQAYEGAIPADLDTTVDSADLTTVRSHIGNSASSAPGAAPQQHFRNIFLPWTAYQLAWAPAVAPGARTDYLYSNLPDTTVWGTAVTIDDGTRIWGPRRTYEHGEQVDENWNRGPLVPAPAAPPLLLPTLQLTGGTGDPVEIDHTAPVPDPLAVLCGACRQDDHAIVHLRPFADSDPAHFGERPGNEHNTSRIHFYRDGALTLTSDNTQSGFLTTPLALPMVPEPAEYRLEWIQSRLGDPNAVTTTAWTFRSAGSDALSSLPDNVTCSPDTTKGCTTLPLLFPSYDLALDTGAGAAAGAPFDIAFTVGHQQHMPAPEGLDATVSVSYDDGVTWSEPVAATERDGTLRAPVTHPALADTNGFVALRVQARDGAGYAVDQTITRAYRLTD